MKPNKQPQVILGGQRKIQTSHHQRKACIYIRQSSLKQVRQHQESQRYQRQLAQLAEALGWDPARIEIIDTDLAQSGQYSQHRSGFQRLVAQLSLGKIGIIFSYEVSRLARNNSDWSRWA